jgi:hypothetical protein
MSSSGNSEGGGSEDDDEFYAFFDQPRFISVESAVMTHAFAFERATVNLDVD